MKEQKTNIGKLFDRIAAHYDALNHLLSLNIDKRWRREAVRSLGKGAGLCLDVATGTADMAIALIRGKKAAKVVGIDLSEQMMERGRAKVERAGLASQITFRNADCARLPFADETFDVVTCAYGVRNFAELDRSLAEMRRVLVHGGELRILEFAYPTRPVIRALYDLYFSHILPLVGGILSHDRKAYDYLPRSVKGFMWGERFVERLQHAGFSETSFISQTFGISMLYQGKKI